MAFNKRNQPTTHARMQHSNQTDTNQPGNEWLGGGGGCSPRINHPLQVNWGSMMECECKIIGIVVARGEGAWRKYTARIVCEDFLWAHWNCRFALWLFFPINSCIGLLRVLETPLDRMVNAFLKGIFDWKRQQDLSGLVWMKINNHRFS